MADLLGAALERLWRSSRSRRGADPETSYTAKLLARGHAEIAQKLGEEAVEAVIEAVKGDRAALVGESADLLYHLWCCGRRRRLAGRCRRRTHAPRGHLRHRGEEGTQAPVSAVWTERWIGRG